MYKILIVEDNWTDRELLKRILSKMDEDLDIKEASSVEAAKAEIERKVPDLILLDIYLPDTDGFALLPELCKNGREDIAVFLVSAFSNQEDKLKGFELGVTDFINKPIIAEELKARVAGQCRLKKIKDERKWEAQKNSEGIKLLYKELENKNIELKRLDGLKDEFVNNVSHELRTPLTIIQESVSVMKDGLLGEINENQRKYLGVTLSNIERLGIIINNLLDISTIENGKLKLHKENVNLSGLVEEVVSFFTPQFAKKGLGIICIVPKESVDVFIDKEKMIQVLVNLIGNAYKFTDKGNIEASVIENDSAVECHVRDTGIGLAPDDISRLFSKFEQIGRQSGAGLKGTGLGLSIAKGIIESHHGQITVTSELGVGTLFTVILPRSPLRKKHRDFMDCLGEVAQKCSNYSVIAIGIKNPDVQNVELLNQLELLIKKQLYRASDRAIRDNGSVNVILSDTKKVDALIVINRIRKIINEKNWEEPFDDVKGFSFKIVSFPQDVHTEEELINSLEINREDL